MSKRQSLKEKKNLKIYKTALLRKKMAKASIAPNPINTEKQKN
jgi:hypothetical protein